MSDFNTKSCSQKQYDLLKKLWKEQKNDIKNFKELLIINEKFAPRDKIKASEASMILKCVLG